MMTDPIGDMLTRIRNAAAVNKPVVIIPYSKIKHKIAEILSQEGYVGSVEKIQQGKFPELKIELKYEGKNSVIRCIKRVSKPGRRVYRGYGEMPIVLNNLGIAIVSTSKGIMTNIKAKKEKLGGEIICEVY